MGSGDFIQKNSPSQLTKMVQCGTLPRQLSPLKGKFLPTVSAGFGTPVKSDDGSRCSSRSVQQRFRYWITPLIVLEALTSIHAWAGKFGDDLSSPASRSSNRDSPYHPYRHSQNRSRGPSFSSPIHARRPSQASPLLMTELSLVESDILKPWDGPTLRHKYDEQRLPSGMNPRKPEDVQVLRVLSFNVQDLLNKVKPLTSDLFTSPSSVLSFLSIGEFKPDLPEFSKDPKKVRGITNVIKDANPDLVVLEEVESLNTLNALNKNYLSEHFTPLLVQGNDSRNINIGMMIRRDLPVDAVYQSYRERRLPESNRFVFSRDLPVLELRFSGKDESAVPDFIFVGVHYKARRDSKDDTSAEHRAAQVRETLSIVGKYSSTWQGVPIVITGDFNCDVTSCKELSPLKMAGFTESMDLLNVPPKSERRVTEVFFPSSGQPVYQQLDAAFLNPDAIRKFRDTEVLRFKDEKTGQETSIWSPKDVAKQNPSDHFPLLSVFEFSAKTVH